MYVLPNNCGKYYPSCGSSSPYQCTVHFKEESYQVPIYLTWVECRLTSSQSMRVLWQGFEPAPCGSQSVDLSTGPQHLASCMVTCVHLHLQVYSMLFVLCKLVCDACFSPVHEHVVYMGICVVVACTTLTETDFCTNKRLPRISVHVHVDVDVDNVACTHAMKQISGNSL